MNAVDELEKNIKITKFYEEDKTGGYSIELVEELIDSLSGDQKFIPAEFLYDDIGSILFDKMVGAKEYYLPKCEIEILNKYSPHIAKTTGSCDIYELGSGSAQKTGVLLKAYKDYDLTYFPIDINQAIMEKGANDLVQLMPDLKINCLAGSYDQAIHSISTKTKKLILYLGSSISQESGDSLLARIHSNLNEGDFMLVAFDLEKDPEVLKSAYQNIETENFNKNALQNVNTILGANFDPDMFEFNVEYNDKLKGCEIHLKSLHEQSVELSEIGNSLLLKNGETICTGVLRKFNKRETINRFISLGFECEETFEDSQKKYSIALLKCGN